jgi:gentisate 1,2-dioxygenase
MKDEYDEHCREMDRQWEEIGKPLWEMLNQMIPREPEERETP